MMVPRRIILSRKGFDGTAGGFPSPIFDDGTMFSIPILEPENPAQEIHTRYSDLRRQGALEFPKSLITSPVRQIDLSDLDVHLDPDIRPELRPAFASKDCEKLLLFGQDGRAQRELSNNGVGEGDLFLFFGWFKDARRDGDSVRFEGRARNRIVGVAHVIWGWLQVEKSHLIKPEGDLPVELKCASHHPHIEHRAYYMNNCVYVGRQHLSFNESLPGAGVFSRYGPALRLTCPNESDQRSLWRLPAFLEQCAVGRAIRGNWERTDDNFRHVQYRGFGQEFVFNVEKHQDEARAWVNRIFSPAGQSI